MILDPRWPRERLARVGRDLSFAWLTLNGLPLPDRVFFDRESANAARRELDPRSKHFIRPEWLGAHQRAEDNSWSWIAVNVPQCHRKQYHPADKNGRPLIQAPGSFEDFTPLGVMCHEVGHHVDYVLHPSSYSQRNGFEAVVDEEEDVSRIEHNVLESFAEAIRLFVTNPDLLRVGRPDRYEYLTKTIGLKPLHLTPWRSVLRNAGKRVRSAAEAWLTF